jgi:predicted trehalose synthase
MDRFSYLLDHRLDTSSTRVIGDFHLARVLSTGKDFVIFDLAGDEDRPISQQRIKRPALRDVASMLRSIALAAQVPRLETATAGSATTKGRNPAVQQWLKVWSAWNSAAFLRGYLAAAKDSILIPAPGQALRHLLLILELESALGQLRHQLSASLSWTQAVLDEIIDLLDRRAS